MTDTQYIVQALVKEGVYRWEDVKSFDDADTAQRCLKKQAEKFPCTRYRLIKFTLIDVIEEVKV